jgi:hypothetical protein
MVEIIWKVGAFGKEFDDAATFSFALFGWDENKLTALSIFELVVLDHSSWRPCSRIQSEA